MAAYASVAVLLLEAHDPAWAKIRAANRFSDLG
jgi:hypothetical protein